MALRLQHLCEEIHDDPRHHVRDRMAPLSGSLGALQREIAEEVCHSMGAAGRKLENALQLAQDLYAQLVTPTEPLDDGAPLLQQYRRARGEAQRRLRYLKIQREALGLRDHRLVDQYYPLPPDC